MIHSLDKTDALKHFARAVKVGWIPPPFQLRDVIFERGGSVTVKAFLDLPIIDGLDAEFSLVVRLLSDGKAIRIRLAKVEVEDIGLRGLAMRIAKKFRQTMGEGKIPGLSFHEDTTGLYAEYRPMKWVILKDIQTADNRLTIVDDGIDFEVFAAEMKAAQIERLDDTNFKAPIAERSFAGSAQIMQMDDSKVTGSQAGRATAEDVAVAVPSSGVVGVGVSKNL